MPIILQQPVQSLSKGPRYHNRAVYSVASTLQIKPATLNAAIVQQLANGLGLTFIREPVETLHATSLQTPSPQTPTSFAPIDLLDYIYAVLHSPAYREKYKEF